MTEQTDDEQLRELLDENYRLSPVDVEEVYKDCLAEDATDTIDVEGIMHTSRFSVAKLEKNKADITKMLEQLQDPFKPVEQGGGGGWTFLNVCEDKHGNLWTGVHWTCEMLIQLGIGTNQAAWLGPREIWQAFPGGMPYLVVYPGGKTEVVEAQEDKEQP